MKIIFLRNKYTMILFKLLIKILPMKFSINLKKGFDQDYFKLHKYNSDNEYIAKQIKKTSDKLNRGWHGAWTNEQTISKLSNYLQKSNKKIGICHGVRTGLEVEWFNNYLGSSNVIGTDIDPVASKKEIVTKWNFQEHNKDWVGKFDFVYSNSHDHSCNPEETLKIWSEQIKQDGFILLDHSRSHGTVYQDKTDCWGVEPELFPFVLLKFQKLDLFVRDMIILDNKVGKVAFIIAKNIK
jgi:hypothetical protein